MSPGRSIAPSGGVQQSTPPYTRASVFGSKQALRNDLHSRSPADPSCSDLRPPCQPPPRYVPFPFVLPPPALQIADRLITTLMILLRAVAPQAPTPTLREAAKQTLFFRLTRLVTHLIRISNFGLPAPAKPKPAPQAPDQAPSPRRPTRPGATASLPRRPGWLLAALPEIAPSIAAGLQALLADPAIAPLLQTAPSLHQALRPLLRSLGLVPAPPTPTAPSPPTAPATNPAAPPPRPSQPPPPAPASKFALLDSRPFHAPTKSALNRPVPPARNRTSSRATTQRQPNCPRPCLRGNKQLLKARKWRLQPKRKPPTPPPEPAKPR